MRRRLAGKRELIEVEAPFVAEEYNKIIGGVDLCDQLGVILTTQRKSRQVVALLFYWTLDLALVDAHIRFRQSAEGGIGDTG